MKTVTSTRQLGDNHSTTHRLSLVAGACALALGASLAHAQTANYSLALTPYVVRDGSSTAATALQTVTNENYMSWASSSQQNESAVNGTVTTNPALLNIDLTGGGATPASLTNNSATATAAGNQYTTTADLATITNPAAPDARDGIGTLATQVQLNRGVTAEVTDTVIKITESGMLAAPATITGNTLAASTTVNSSDTTVSGVVPVGYVSGNAGSISVNYTAAGAAEVDTQATTTASVNLNTFQTNLDNTTSASVTGSNVQLDITDTANTGTSAPVYALGEPLTVSSNTLSAKLDVNKSSNVFQATAGSNAFTGSVGVTNVQANVITDTALTGGSTATVSGSSITSDLTRTTTDTTTSLTGALEQSSNTISASVSGNSVGARDAAGDILAGNAILLTSGADLTGSPSTTTNQQTSGNSSAGSTTQADLVMLNLQRNDNTNLSSTVDGGLITARADNVTTGSITLNSNSVASSAEGNLAGNLIKVSATNSTATAAAANVQANSGTPIIAQNFGSLVTANVGDTGATVNGTVTLKQNSLSATASGNASATNVVMLASNLTAQENSAATAASVAVAAGSTTATAGLSATNLQSNISDTVANSITANLTGNRVAAYFTQSGAFDGTAVPLTNATVSLDQNALTASATGNSASTGVTLTGVAGAASNATVQAAVGNSQINDNTGDAVMAVSSEVLDSGVRMLGGAATTSQLSVSSNTLASSAMGSSAANTLAANVTNLTVGQNLLASNAASVNTSTATSTAALGLASVQINEAAVTASNTATVATTPFAGVQVDSAVGSQLTTSGNQASASSTGNSVDNTVQVIATTLASTTGEANAIAALSNLQSNAVTGAASASVGASGTLTTSFVGLQVNGAVTDSAGVASTLTVSNNGVSAKSLGNTGSNQLAVSGTTLTSTAPTVATGLSSTATTGGNVTSEFALVNLQQDAVSVGRTADATNVVVGINTISELSNSNLTVANNTVSAEARSNDISNTASLTGFATLTTSAGLLNTQNASTDVTATVTGASTGVVANGALDSANVTIDSNTVQGLAMGSLASNSLTASAAVLAGNPMTTVTQTGVASTNQTAGTVVQTADFSLANNQGQSGDVTALVGATQTFVDNLDSDVMTSSITVTGNSVQGIAQSLSASNTLNLSGATSATATAGLANLQVSSAGLSATTSATQGIVSGLYGSNDSNLTVSDNAAKALALGTSANNTLNVSSANLTGNSQVTSSGGGASYTVATPASTTADFAVSNVQQQSGGLTAALSSSQLANIGSADVLGGAITVSGNTAASVAQANSAASSLTLTGAKQSDLTGALLSVQTATAGVSATQVASDGSNTFAVRTYSLHTTPVTVSNNSLLVSAGMNEAFNQQTVSGATQAADAPRGNDTTAYTLGTNAATLASASSGAAFTVQNVQSGDTADSVSATAQPERIGITSVDGFTNSNLTVSGNAVTAKANVNYASNALNLAASNTQAGSGSVSNVQTSAVGGGVTATIGDTDTRTSVGIASPVPVTGSTLTVSGNALNAQAGGNTAVNALNATALNSIGNGGVSASTSGVTGTTGSSNTATFAVLNYQGNSSAMNATVQFASIGLRNSTSLIDSNAVVQNNAVLASGYGNTASNSLGLSALTGNANAASAGISNVQYNLASVTASVSNVSNGIVGAAGVTGGQATVSGNSVAAQAVGNSAVNRIVALR